MAPVCDKGANGPLCVLNNSTEFRREFKERGRQTTHPKKDVMFIT